MKTLLLVLAYPLGEIAGFVLVGGWLGLFPTLGLVILSGVAGVLILRRQALAAGQDLRGSLSGMRGSVFALAEGALISLGAVLLILPGFLSDVVALLLLIPPVRRGLIAVLSRRIKGVRPQAGRRGNTADGTIIDGTFYEADPDANGRPPIDRPSGWTRH